MGTFTSLVSVSLPSFTCTLMVTPEIDALLDLLTLRPCKDLGTLGVGEMSASKFPVRFGNGIDASLLSSSELASLGVFTFNKSSSELISDPSVNNPLRSALDKESSAVLVLVAGCLLRLANACTALD